MERSNRINEDIVDLLKQNKLLIMRDRLSQKPLGIAYSEEGLRAVANKNGVYLYCRGRVTSFNEAKVAKKSPNIIIERFIPKKFKDNSLVSAEIHWINQARHMLKQY